MKSAQAQVTCEGPGIAASATSLQQQTVSASAGPRQTRLSASFTKTWLPAQALLRQGHGAAPCYQLPFPQLQPLAHAAL
jgi:hypothetical protein